MSQPDDTHAARRLHEAAARIRAEVAKTVVGQDRVVELMLIALLARGHALMVGVPGLAKTLLVKTLAASLHLNFNRIQFTPDLMPSDITGTDILENDSETGRRSFKFVRGPVFCNLLLADEINRTPPKTQAALLQAMQEGFVTAFGVQHTLTPPFLVFATQNPIEQEGTYPLPEAQLDRFMFHINVEYPSIKEEEEIVVRQSASRNAVVEPVLTPSEILELQSLVERVPAPPHVVSYAVRLLRAGRPQDDSADDFVRRMVRYGAGPRASQTLVSAAKARAVLHGRTAVEAGDIAALAPSVLRHRIIPNFHAEAEGVNAVKIIAHLLERVTY
ncbi:MAG: MoxR family ATPase [Fibrobacterota bacterium]